MATLTMGIDLAAQPENTAACILRWEGSAPALVSLVRGIADDQTALHTKWLSTTAYGIRGDFGGPITKVGIDAPFGWPEPFLDAVAEYRDGPRWPTGLDNPLDRCRLRETDRAVHRRTGKWPLSVSAERIAMPAMRCAALLTDIAEHITEAAVSRDGSGLCCEVYPDPALRHWVQGTDGDPGGSYKGPKNAARRLRALEALLDQLPISNPERLLSQVGADDDYLDALICALVARAVEVGRTVKPETPAERAAVGVEGWIHVPVGGLTDLRLG